MAITRQTQQFMFDAEYVRQLKSNSRPVAEHFGAYFTTALTNFLRLRTKSPELVEDIRQDTLLRVLRDLDKLHKPECLAAFVFGVCKNVRKERIRNQARYVEFEPTAQADDAADPEIQAIAGQRAAAIRAALAELPGRERQVITLWLEGAASSEVAGYLGISEVNARVALHRARTKLTLKLTAKADVN